MAANEHYDRELLRLRDRVHKIEATLRAVELFADRIATIERDVHELDEAVKRLATADAIAEAVAARLGERDQVTFTRTQLWGIRAAIAGAVLGGALEIVRTVGAL